MRKILLILVLPGFAFADRLGSLKSTADVLLTTQAVSGASSSLETMVNGVRVSSPTASVNLVAGTNVTLSGSLTGGGTAQVTINASGGTTVLQSSGVAFGSATNTVTSDTMTLSYVTSQLSLNAPLSTFNSFGFFPPSGGYHYYYKGATAEDSFGVYANAGAGSIALLSGTIGSGITPTGSGNIRLIEGGGFSISGLDENVLASRFNQFGDFRTHQGWVHIWPDSTTIVADGHQAVTVSTNGVTLWGTINLSSSTASQFVKTDGSNNLVSYDLLNATQAWTGGNTFSSMTVNNITINGTCTGSGCGSGGGGSGIVSPGTFTWTNTNGFVGGEVTASSVTASTGSFSNNLFVNTANASSLVTLGVLPTDASYAGLWLAQTSPDVTNYSFLANSTGVLLNAPSSLNLRLGNTDAFAMSTPVNSSTFANLNESLHMTGGGILELTYIADENNTNAYLATSLSGHGGYGWVVANRLDDQVLLMIRATASQTANLTEWSNSSQNPLTVVDHRGWVGVSTGTPQAPLDVNGYAIFDSSMAIKGTVNVSSGVLLSGAAGTNGQVLTSGGAGTVPTWTTVAGGSSSLNQTRGVFTFPFSLADFTSSGSTKCVVAVASGTVTGWSVISDSGTVNFNAKSESTGTYASSGYPTTSQCGTDCPKYTTALYNENRSLSAWTTTVNYNDVWCVDVDSVTVSPPTYATVQIYYTKTQ